VYNKSERRSTPSFSLREVATATNLFNHLLYNISQGPSCRTKMMIVGRYGQGMQYLDKL